MSQALRYFKELTDQHVLVQVWAPVKDGDRHVLTTSGQPFVLDPQSIGLLQYRTVSLMYMFSVDEESNGVLGLPGRVYRQQQPEWTPNVQYYSSKEYPRLNHALYYDVRGTLALPVFDSSGKSCVGVVEMIMTSQKINYAPDVDKVCKALEAVNLKSSEIMDHPRVQICNEGRQAAFAEILEILTAVCETHKLPLAQTWVPCRHRNVLVHGGGLKKNCSSIDGSCMGQVCMSTTDVAFYIIDGHMWGFRDACVEHHLQKGQGVAGRAYKARQACFSRDVTQFSKTEYPLVHYAKWFGLRSCFAICLQSSESGSDDYILEFFMPVDLNSSTDQQALLDSILTTMKQHCRSLKFAANTELPDGGVFVEIINMSATDANGDAEVLEGLKIELSGMLSTEENAVKAHLIGGPGKELSHHASCGTYPSPLDDLPYDENVIPDTDAQEQPFVTDDDVGKESNQIINSDGCGTSNSSAGDKSKKKTERRRGKAEKSISLDVLQHYFAGSLKDAAKSLGVCPTTMKRICRQHGISRWPSRKINKVNRSLSKLKRVIESVQGAEGTFNITSLTCPIPVAVGSISWPAGLGCSKQNGAPEEKELSPHHSPERDDHHNKLLVHQKLISNQTGSQPEPGQHADSSKSRSSSGEPSGNSHTSQGSCQGSPINETCLGVPISPLNLEQQLNTVDCLGSQPNAAALCSMPDAAEIADQLPLLGGMLIQDSGSSKDLKLLFTTMEGCPDEQVNASNNSLSQPAAVQDSRTVTIKASYKEDIIRFRLPCNAGVVALKDEVAKRLKLENGLFDIKYLDDDHEWVVLACDADLEECMEIAKLSGGRLIRLAVHDVVVVLGSSCESSE
ncbi:protein NLP3-like isoform X3 [Dioscorea cayenensis subsp. rotundata]|nr:protein NLP3-like isoform X3 [Dioscorea cayenensis subsp. rotundata]